MPEGPTISVVIAAWPDAAGLDCCLGALAARRGEAAEVVVVPGPPLPAALAERFPWVSWVGAGTGRLIPHLWGRGAAGARGDVVALTTSHFTPAADWVAAVRAAHARLAAPAGGGRGDPPRGGGGGGWGAPFLPPSGLPPHHPWRGGPAPGR